MVSKNQIKRITGLQQKKFRIENGLFIAEGLKVVGELLDSHYELEHLYVTADIFTDVDATKRTVIDASDLKKISCLAAPNVVLALFKIPEPLEIGRSGLIVALDDVRDPGNLGTIIRLCDWFGVRQIVCSNETADLYNPKVIQASMGSVARVQVNYVNLCSYLKQDDLSVFGTFMDGENIYRQTLPKEGILIFGNEANGISEAIERTIKNRISIPRFGNLQQTESLNVATAAAIVLSEFRRLS